MYQTCQCPQVEWFSLMWQHPKNAHGKIEEPLVNVVWAGGGCFYTAIPKIVSYHNDMYFIKLLLGFLLYILILPFEQSLTGQSFSSREKSDFFRKWRWAYLRNSNLWNGGVFWAVWNYFQRVEQPAGVLNREKEIVESFWILPFVWKGSNERIWWCWRIHWNSQHLVHNEVREASFWKVLRECGHRPISFWPPSPSRSNWNTHL